MIETTWLRAIATFAEDANLSRTARTLHLSQPAVHAQLRKLGEALGVTLYRRKGRGLVLTLEGIEVAAFARELDERTRGLAARLRGERDDAPVVLAAGSGSLLYVIGEGLRDFTKRKRGRLELLTRDAHAAIDAVRTGLAHVGVAAVDAAIDDLAYHALTTVPQVVVVPRAHRLAVRRHVKLADLDGETLVMPPEPGPQRVALDAILHANGVKIRIGAVARGWELTLKLVEIGLGIAIVNGSCAIPKGLVARPVLGLPPVRYVAFTRPRPSDSAKDLVGALVAHREAWRGRTSPRR